MFLDPGETSTPSRSSVSVLPALIAMERASAMRSFRDSLAWPPRLLCTLRADVTADYATLASGWWLSLAGSPVPVTGFIQLISLSFDTSFNYGLFTARSG